MRVIDNGNEELTLYWVDYNGATRSYGKVGAGKTWAVTTYGTDSILAKIHHLEHIHVSRKYLQFLLQN